MDKIPTTDDLVGQIRSLAMRKGSSLMQIFDDMLEYFIGYFCVNNKPNPAWGTRYTQEDNKAFTSMLQTYCTIMQHQLARNEWYDAFGDVYMELVPKGGSKGQFFTPKSICELMAEAMLPPNDEEPSMSDCGTWGTRPAIADPAAGSGRGLLAADALLRRKKIRKPFLSAEDVDLTCCKMSAINLMVHGCYGEVVCHNTLSEPDTVRVGYVINEGLYPFHGGLPTIRKCDNPEQFRCTLKALAQ